MGGIAVVVCDLDGVVRHFDADALSRIERAHGLSQGTIARIALSPARLAPAVCGAISDEEWRAGVAEELAASIGPRHAREAVAAWSEDVSTVDRAIGLLDQRPR
jgi:putative hydrolase of the HAD superfamily